jgi:hypothetical protein
LKKIEKRVLTLYCVGGNVYLPKGKRHETKLNTCQKARERKKVNKMTKSVRAMRLYLNGINTNTKDSGRAGKAFEIGICTYITRRTRTKVKKQGKTDIRFTKDGKRYTCEIKSACGELDGTDKSQFIIYCPTVDTDTPAEEQGYVFTRDEWQAFINGYTGRGSFIRVDANRGHAHIQSFYVSETVRPKASKPIARYIAETMATMPTVEEFFNK